MSRLWCFLLFSVVVVHGTDGSACTGDLDFINPAYWPVLRNLGSSLRDARFVNVGSNNRYGQAVVHTTSKQTYIYGPSYIYGTGSSRVRELNEIKGRDIKDVLFGNSFLVVLEYGGSVWTAGHNYYGQLSGGTTDRARLARVQLPGTVKEIGVGYHHSVVLTTDGQLFSWGFNGYGSLGYISRDDINPNPRSFTLGTGVSRPNKICCGAYACAVLTGNSGVYSWGYPEDIGRTGDYRVPGQVLGIPSDQVITELSCGLHHTVAVSSSGHLYGWGQNYFGELLQTFSGATRATLLALGVTDAVAGHFLTVVRYESDTSGFFGRYNGVDYRIPTTTTSHTPRDLLARGWFSSRTVSTTRGIVGLCG